MSAPRLYFFQRAEFYRDAVDWFDQMDPRLLVMLDILRHRWRRPIRISAHPAALGRRDGNSESQHNVDRWGQVRAADVQPAGVETEEEAYQFYLAAKGVGFTGIGVYPHWVNGVGFHLDVRADRDPGNPAVWGGVMVNGSQTYVSAHDGFEAVA